MDYRLLHVQEGDTVASWLKRCLKVTGMTRKIASQAAGLGEAQVSSYSKPNNTRRPSPDACVALAHLFHVSATDVLWIAGYLKNRPRDLIDPVAQAAISDLRIKHIVDQWQRLPDEERQFIADLVDFRAGRSNAPLDLQRSG